MSETMTQQPAATEEAEKLATASGVLEPGDVLDHLLKPEVQTSLNTLVEQLPKLTEMVSLLTQAYDFGMLVATDKVLLNDMVGGIKEVVQPLQEKAKDVASAAIEAGERARVDQSTISAFGLLRMLKDPQVQKMLRFTQAFLNVMSERETSHR